MGKKSKSMSAPTSIKSRTTFFNDPIPIPITSYFIIIHEFVILYKLPLWTIFTSKTSKPGKSTTQGEIQPSKPKFIQSSESSELPFLLEPQLENMKHYNWEMEFQKIILGKVFLKQSITSTQQFVMLWRVGIVLNRKKLIDTWLKSLMVLKMNMDGAKAN